MPYEMDRQMFFTAADREGVEILEGYVSFDGSSSPAILCAPEGLYRFLANVAADSEYSWATDESEWLIYNLREIAGYDRTNIYYWPGLILV